jgi:pyruvate/2-oxoglutarate dehydrogenase complex dihydrolipoamide acyltransferase (E2) component
VAERSFPLPDLGEGLLDATVLEWLVRVGDTVAYNDPIVELETTKSALEIPSPIGGVVSALHGSEGEIVKVGELLISFTVPDEEAGIVGTVPVEADAVRHVRLRKPGE